MLFESLACTQRVQSSIRYKGVKLFTASKTNIKRLKVNPTMNWKPVDRVKQRNNVLRSHLSKTRQQIQAKMHVLAFTAKVAKWLICFQSNVTAVVALPRHSFLSESTNIM